MDFTGSLYCQRAVSVKFNFIAPLIAIWQFLRAQKEHGLDESGSGGHQTSLGMRHTQYAAATDVLD
jgi:hypothetical protein